MGIMLFSIVTATIILTLRDLAKGYALGLTGL